MISMKIVALCAAFVAAAPLQAQNTGLEFGGSVLNHDMLWATDLAQLSQTHVFGTARVMGMGGAFTSLGADLSSMSLNPAGLGMYRRNEISLTPLVPMAKASTAGTASWKGNSKSQFAFANVGVALNVFESSRSSLTSLTLGIGMFRIADFNSRFSFSSVSRYDPDRPDRLMPTIADIFSQQMNNFGVRPDREAEGGGPNGPVPVDAWNPNVWPAILAYDAYMLGNYGTVKDPIWAVERIGRNASVLHSMDVVNSGSINEFTISMGGNINNILYIGASIGILSLHNKLVVTYQEDYGYFNSDGFGHDGSGNALAEQLDVMNLYQEMEMNGSGVNFKLGFTARPLTGLRVGVAFHTPTSYSLDYSYRADIFSEIRNTADDNPFNITKTQGVFAIHNCSAGGRKTAISQLKLANISQIHINSVIKSNIPAISRCTDIDIDTVLIGVAIKLGGSFFCRKFKIIIAQTAGIPFEHSQSFFFFLFRPAFRNGRRRNRFVIRLLLGRNRNVRNSAFIFGRSIGGRFGCISCFQRYCFFRQVV